MVNLSADTPSRARDTSAWAAEHGIGYLDGAIMTPTPTIGTPDGVFLYSGPEELYQERQPTLDVLSGTHTHLGTEIGRAAAYDIALLDIFWTAVSGYTHAVALARAEGVTAQELAPFAQGIGTILPEVFGTGAEYIDRGEHPGDNNPVT